MATNNFPPRLQVFYQDCADNIRFLKQQQWRVTNYALLIYAAVYLLHSELSVKACEVKAGLSVLLALAWLFSLFVLYQLERSMDRFRDRIDWIYRERFTEKEQVALSLLPKTSDQGIFRVLIAVSSIGAAILLSTIIWLPA